MFSSNFFAQVWFLLVKIKLAKDLKNFLRWLGDGLQAFRTNFRRCLTTWVKLNLNFKLETAQELLINVNLNSTFAKPMNLSLVFAKLMNLNLKVLIKHLINLISSNQNLHRESSDL